MAGPGHRNQRSASDPRRRADPRAGGPGAAPDERQTQMNHSAPLLTAIAAILLFGSPALADRGTDETAREAKRAAHAERMFERADANADGAIDDGEFLAAAQHRFETRDVDGDGYLDRTEFFAPRERPEGAPELTPAQQEKRAEFGARIFALLDKDDDGRVSDAEAAAAGERMFARLDADGDGRIARDEIGRHGRGDPAKD